MDIVRASSELNFDKGVDRNRQGLHVWSSGYQPVVPVPVVGQAISCGTQSLRAKTKKMLFFKMC